LINWKLTDIPEGDGADLIGGIAGARYWNRFRCWCWFKIRLHLSSVDAAIPSQNQDKNAA